MSLRWKAVAVAVAMAVAAPFAATAAAADGERDPSFGGGDGEIVLDVTAGEADLGIDSVVQRDGKIVVVGLTGSAPGGARMSVSRFNRDGSPDAGFGAGQSTLATVGTIIVPAGFMSRANAVALQSDGKIIVAGVQKAFGETAVLVRLTRQGALDTTFGGDGIVTMTRTEGLEFTDVVSVADGKIAVIGTEPPDVDGSPTLTHVVRYTKTGTLDSGFGGGDGIATIPLTLYAEEIPYRLRVQPDGKLVAMVVVNTGSDLETRVLRLTQTGSLDRRFGGGDGVVPVPDTEGHTVVGTALALLPNGRVLLAGQAYAGGVLGFGASPVRMALVRVSARGTVDRSFGGDGAVLTAFPATQVPSSVVAQSDGKIVVTSSSLGGVTTARFTRAGALDPSFGSFGYVVDSTATSVPAHMSVAPDGRLVVGGTYSGSDRAHVARLVARSSLRRTRSFAAADLVAPQGVVIASGSRVSLTVAARSRNVCRRQGTRIVGTRAGTCRVTVAVTPPRSRAVPRPTTSRTRVVVDVVN